MYGGMGTGGKMGKGRGQGAKPGMKKPGMKKPGRGQPAKTGKKIKPLPKYS